MGVERLRHEHSSFVRGVSVGAGRSLRMGWRCRRAIAGLSGGLALAAFTLPASALVAPIDGAATSTGAATTGKAGVVATSASASDVGRYVTLNYMGNCLTTDATAITVKWEACLQPDSTREFLLQVWKVTSGGLPRGGNQTNTISIMNVGSGLNSLTDLRSPSALNPSAEKYLGTDVTRATPTMAAAGMPEWHWETNTLLNSDKDGEFALYSVGDCSVRKTAAGELGTARLYMLDHGKPTGPYLYVRTAEGNVTRNVAGQPQCQATPPPSTYTAGQKHRWTSIDGSTLINGYVAKYDAARKNNTPVIKPAYAPAGVPNVTSSPSLQAYDNNKVTLSWAVPGGVAKPFTGQVRSDIAINLNVTIASYPFPQQNLNRYWNPLVDQTVVLSVRHCSAGSKFRDIDTSAMVDDPTQVGADWVLIRKAKARVIVTTTPRCSLTVSLVRIA